MGLEPSIFFESDIFHFFDCFMKMVIFCCLINFLLLVIISSGECWVLGRVGRGTKNKENKKNRNNLKLIICSTSPIVFVIFCKIKLSGC